VGVKRKGAEAVWDATSRFVQKRIADGDLHRKARFISDHDAGRLTPDDPKVVADAEAGDLTFSEVRDQYVKDIQRALDSEGAPFTAHELIKWMDELGADSVMRPDADVVPFGGGAISPQAASTTASSDKVAELVRLGYPESTAQKIASGELPMDQASRMARAKEQGFDVDQTWYHGTPDNRGLREEGFKTPKERFGQTEDDPRKAFFFSKRRSTAATYADDRRAFDYQNADPEVLELLVDPGDTKSVGWAGRPFRGEGYALDDTIDAARDDGLNSLRVDNIRDTYNAGGAPDSVLVKMEREGIRDAKDAAFDPDQKDSANLLAGGAAAAVGLGAATQSDESEAGVFSPAKTAQRIADRLRGAGFKVGGQHTTDDGVSHSKTSFGESSYIPVYKEYMRPDGRRGYLSTEIRVSDHSTGERRYSDYTHVGSEEDADRVLDQLLSAADERGFATPEALAATATAAATFAQMRQEKQGRWAQMREDLVNTMANVAEFTFDTLELPLRGYAGLSAVGGSLAAGDGLQNALMHGANDARSYEQATANMGGAVTDQAAKYVSPEAAAAAGAAVYTGLNVLAPGF